MKRPFFTLAVGFVLGEVLALQGKMAGITALAKGLAAFMAVCAAVYFLMMVKGRGLKRLLPFLRCSYLRSAGILEDGTKHLPSGQPGTVGAGTDRERYGFWLLR